MSSSSQQNTQQNPQQSVSIDIGREDGERYIAKLGSASNHIYDALDDLECIWAENPTLARVCQQLGHHLRSAHQLSGDLRQVLTAVLPK